MRVYDIKKEHSRKRNVPFSYVMAKPYMSKMSYEVARSLGEAILRMNSQFVYVSNPSAKQTIEHRRCGFASLHRFLCTALDAELSFILCTAVRAEPLHFHRFFRFLGTTFRTELTTVFCTAAADPFTCCRCALLRSRSCLLRLGLCLLLGSHVK